MLSSEISYFLSFGYHSATRMIGVESFRKIMRICSNFFPFKVDSEIVRYIKKRFNRMHHFHIKITDFVTSPVNFFVLSASLVHVLTFNYKTKYGEESSVG